MALHAARRLAAPVRLHGSQYALGQQISLCNNRADVVPRKEIHVLVVPDGAILALGSDGLLLRRLALLARLGEVLRPRDEFTVVDLSTSSSSSSSSTS
eukprot:1307288-Pyramimonas_sp.AAC.2